MSNNSILNKAKYTNNTDEWYQSTSKRYGAKRGESTSLLKYTTPEQAERFKRCADDEYDVFKNPKGIWV